MNIRNLTLEEINSAPATKVAEWLAEYNKWRRSEPPYAWGGDKMPFTPRELGDIINRAVELLCKPLRNCDVGTPQEQEKRLEAFCAKQFRYAVADDNPCAKCPIFKKDTLPCVYRFLQMPYEKGEE